MENLRESAAHERLILDNPWWDGGIGAASGMENLRRRTFFQAFVQLVA